MTRAVRGKGSTVDVRSCEDPVAERTRRRARRTGTGVVVALALVAAYFLALGAGAFLGERAWQQERHSDAERWFRMADRIDLVERWKAPYGVGVAAFSQGRWLEAAELFARARGVAPDHVLCRVVLNEALALEVLGDELAAADDKVGARTRWAQAQEALSGAQGCSAAGEDESGQDTEEESPEESQGEEDAGGSDDGDAEPEPEQLSEAQQLEAAAQRLQDNLTGAPDGPRAQSKDDPTRDKQAELQERSMGAARTRSSEQDGAVGPGGSVPDRPTW